MFQQKRQENASNIIDSRWVVKWKWDQETVDAGTSKGAKAESKRTIRSRLTVRGFKDVDKDNIEKYAGTSSRYAQKLLASEAARQRWGNATADISKAFLQGVTRKEMAEAAGTEEREVNFTLPKSQIAILRKVPGFENFDPEKEVLHLDKPGTGLVDAPRAFSLKLASITMGKRKMVASSVDPELCMRFTNGKLS